MAWDATELLLKDRHMETINTSLISKLLMIDFDFIFFRFLSNLVVLAYV